MSLQISLPFGNKNNVKSLVFSILAKEYPLKIVEIKNFISKRYGKNVSFQAVRKAMLELVEDGILLKENNTFVINKQWVFDSKRTMDELYSTIYQEREKPAKVDSIGEEVSVFTFNSIGEMMKFWQQLIGEWLNNINESSLKVNCWQGAHAPEALIYPDAEQKVFSQIKKKKVRSYLLLTGFSRLDKLSLNFYKEFGIKCAIAPSQTLFDKEYSVGTYGDLVVQTLYPKEVISALDSFYKKTKTLQDLNLSELYSLLNKKVEVKLSVSKNIHMARQINQSIISQI